jgi:hypothetical protein
MAEQAGKIKSSIDQGKLYKYGYFQALIVENLHGILLRFWFYLKKIIFINVIQGFSVFFLLVYIEIFSSNISSHSTTWTLFYAAESVNHYQRELVC